VATGGTPGGKKKAEKERAVVLYQDEAVFQQAGSVIRTWALVGIGIHVLSPPVRKSVKVMGAVRVGANPQWHSRFVEVFNAATFIEFLNQLLRYYRGTKIHLITDNAQYHKSPTVQRWLEGEEDLIELHFLPPYSPNLNAVEYLWRKTKRAITHNKFFPKLRDLKDALARPKNFPFPAKPLGYLLALVYAAWRYQ
jgi:transposase